MKKVFFIQHLKYLLLGLLFLTNNLFAQQILQPTDEKTYTEYMDKVLESVKMNDANEFKNGILYDRVFSMAKLNEFNQTNSTNTSSYSHFKRAWQELYTASLNPNFFSSQKIDDIAYSYERQGIIQIGIINIDYTQIDTTALKQDNPKLEIVNQKIERIANKNPYEHKHVTVISVLNSETIFGSSVEFEFGKIFLNKSEKQIINLTAYFDNNQTFSIISNGSFVNTNIRVDFIENGLKEVVFDIEYSDNTFKTTSAIFPIDVTPPDYSQIQYITATKPYQGYDETSDCGGTCFGKGEYKVYLSDSHSVITKPYILLDGFDPLDKRKISSVESIKEGDDNIYDMMNYKIGSIPHNFVETLNEEGYDVIILSFPRYLIRTVTYEYEYWDEENQTWETEYGSYNIYRDGGTDYIQRNAKVLEALIHKVNTILTYHGSNEKLIIAGPSMGSVVSQYALVEMEQNGENHNVGLWISFDGTHKGGNISIGIQKAVEYFDFNDGLYALNTKVAKQTLIDHYLHTSSGYVGGAPNFRDQFQNELDNMGFPQQCRNIAVLNGSITGNEKGNVAENMVYVKLVYGAGFLKRDLWLNDTSNSGSKLIFRYLKKNWWGANTQVDIKKYRNTNSSYGSLDNSPGGFTPIKSRIEEELGGSFPYYYMNGIHNIPNLQELMDNADMGGWFKKLLMALIVDFGYINFTDDSNFVPTKSAIAYSGSNNQWREVIGTRNLVCTGETPFDSYYAPSQNEAHVSLNEESAIWLLQEINGNPHQIPKIYGNSYLPNIIGDNEICYNETKTYTLSNSCMGDVTWTKSGNLSIESSSDFEVTVKSNDNNQGLAWIKATFDNGDSVIKNLLGKPYYELYDDGEIMEIIKVEDGIPLSQQGITDIIWVADTGFIDEDPYPYNYNVSYYGQASGHVDVYNSCGKTTLNFNVSGNNQNNCENPNYIIESLGQDKYKLVDTCDPDNIQYVDSSELYDNYGVKIQDLIPQQDEVDMSNTSNSGEIRIIMFIKDGQVFTKMVIAD